MDHNLEDSLNMESIESMDFDHSAVVVNQADIALEDSNPGGDMPMDLDTIQEQPALHGLDSGHEEVIVSDFMGDQFGFQEFTMQGDNSTGANIKIEANQLKLAGRNEHIDLQYADNALKPATSQHNIITIKAVQQPRPAKKATAALPRQVAIAPKPVKGAPNVQYAIAPKPVAVVVNKTNVAKSMGFKNVVAGTLKGNTVLAQIGKQLVMMPAGGHGQKIKLTSLLQSSASNESIQLVRCNSDQAQLIANKGTAKPIRTKFIVQGTGVSEVSEAGGGGGGVLTKLVPVSTAGQTRYVMHQKTVPISIAQNKMVITTPPKQAVKVAPKKQIIAIKSQSPKSVTSQANVTTKKVVISANPSQNVILKPAGTKTVNAQGIKNTSLVQNQRTQIHPINVPGKGIQLIKLVTNQAPVQKPPPLAVSAKNFLLTDSKGNIIQMSADKIMSSQPPPLIVTSSASAIKLAPKSKRLVRIAPISQKGETTTLTTGRSSQSLLAPLEAPTAVSVEQLSEVGEQPSLHTVDTAHTLLVPEGRDLPTTDVKPTLASLISDAVAGEESVPEEHLSMEEVEIEYENTPMKHEQYFDGEHTTSMDNELSNEKHDENVIIVPSAFSDSRQNEDSYQEDSNMSNGDNQDSQNVESEVLRLLSPKTTQNYLDASYSAEGKCEPPSLRARKACNCTKSQCLKLYCDCFANGEFCHNCNCNNCLNNLDNEELRQNAIRACLERNPNAFRPKIGKGKTGGPEIIRRHNKGCNCKRSGCLKNYCECYEAKIACTLMCKCVGCRNVQETLERRRFAVRAPRSAGAAYRPPVPLGPLKQPCSFVTAEVIEAVAQCMLAAVAVAEVAGGAGGAGGAEGAPADPVEDILLEFSHCMADIITASHQAL